jgi:four helix bundle protein
MRDFRRLAVWDKAHRLTLDTYSVTAEFPREELYGLTSQLRRAASSIPANIAEGCGRDGDVEFARFLGIAMGSANELEYHLILARDLGYLTNTSYEAVSRSLDEVKRMLTGLVVRLKTGRSKLEADSPQL